MKTTTETALEVKNVLVPLYVSDGWMIFQYTAEDKEPWKWPKVLKYQEKFFKWMSWNSDNNHVNYKQISINDLATKV